MRIFKTQPEESKQWQSDAPGIKAMRIIMPIAALLSAVSLAGGVASFFQLGLTTTAGICLTAALAVAAWYFDGLAVSSGQSVVRESILAFIRKEIKVDVLFWINLAFSALICGATVFGSFTMSRNGISYLVMEVRKTKEIRTATDTTLAAAVAGATDDNAGVLSAIREANDARREAITSRWVGEIEALEAEIGRRQAQRTADNTYYIDKKIAEIGKQIGEAKASRGEELAALAEAFSGEQARVLAAREDLTAVVIDDAKAAADRRKIQQTEKDEADRALSGLVAAIFSWSIILMLIIGLRLEILHTRNGILPNPILGNSDLSGSTMILRFIMAVPNFLFACLTWVSEWLYQVAPKHRTPIVDNDLVDFKAAQAKVVAIRKEGKQKQAAARREIGYRQAAAAANYDGQTGAKMTARNTASITGTDGPVSRALENGENSGQNEPQKEIIYREVDSSLRDCIECGTTYQARAHNQKFCGQSCKTTHHQKKNGGTAFDPAKFHGKKF